MAHAEHTVTIDRAPEVVFDFLDDGSNNREWRAGVIEVGRASGDGGTGTVWRQTMRGPGGRTIRGDYRITEHDRPRVLGFEVVAGPARPTGRFDLSAATTSGAMSGATALTFTLDLHPRGFMRLVAPMVQRQMTKEVAAIETLKRVLEAR
jgi:uncharacterized protein YndB with AHSA1/START domain